MFTGLVRGLAEVVSLAIKPGGAVLGVKAEAFAAEAALGDSIAVNGACLTVAGKKDGVLAFDLSGETLKSTVLGGLKQGEKVNLETALRASDQLGGHMVTGHVDATGRVRSRQQLGETVKITIEAPPVVLDYLVPKGSVAVDGISLTVVEVLAGAFTIVIIPHTLANTTIGFKEPGAAVNLESDIIGKYVAKFVARQGKDSSGGLLMKALGEAGFIKG